MRTDVAGLRQRRLRRGLPTGPVVSAPTARALESIHRTEEEQRPTRLAERTLECLRERRLIYTCRTDRGTFAHLTAAGAEAIAVDPGDRR
jgi:hypothetical protein